MDDETVQLEDLLKIWPLDQLKMTSKKIEERPDGVSFGRGDKHFVCHLHWSSRTPMGGKSPFKFYYTIGSAVKKIDLASVLWSLASDASALDYDSYEEWADEYGYDKDSRKGFKLYARMLDTSERFVDFIGVGLIRKITSAEY